MLQRILAGVRVRTVQAWPVDRVAVQLSAPMATISFDDWPRSAWVAGGPILERFGVKATYFTCAGLLGKPSTEMLADYATTQDVKDVAAAGHEVACHTFSHVDCRVATAQALAADLERNRIALEDLAGASPRSFAYPYGRVSLVAKRLAARRYGSSRGIRQANNVAPFDLAQLSAYGLERFRGTPQTGPLAEFTARHKTWLHLFTHDVSDDPSPFGCRPSELTEALRALAANGIEVVTQAEGTERLRKALAQAG